MSDKPDLDLLALHGALEELATVDPQQSRIVELKFFGGLSIEETAEVLDIGHATVERDWKMARAWLRRKLEQALPREPLPVFGRNKERFDHIGTDIVATKTV